MTKEWMYQMKKRYISEPMPYTEDIRFLYRWDSRPPEVINKSGFQGAENVYFKMSFGMRTVFCSVSLKGSGYYFQELENGMSSYGGGGCCSESFSGSLI